MCDSIGCKFVLTCSLVVHYVYIYSVCSSCWFTYSRCAVGLCCVVVYLTWHACTVLVSLLMHMHTHTCTHTHLSHVHTLVTCIHTCHMYTHLSHVHTHLSHAHMHTHTRHTYAHSSYAHTLITHTTIPLLFAGHYMMPQGMAPPQSVSIPQQHAVAPPKAIPG